MSYVPAEIGRQATLGLGARTHRRRPVQSPFVGWAMFRHQWRQTKPIWAFSGLITLIRRKNEAKRSQFLGRRWPRVRRVSECAGVGRDVRPRPGGMRQTKPISGFLGWKWGFGWENKPKGVVRRGSRAQVTHKNKPHTPRGRARAGKHT